MIFNRPWHRAIAGLLFASSSFTAIAQQPHTASPSSHHSLWKVAGPSNTVYLLGSVHVLKDSDYPLAAVIESAFSNSQVVVFETDIAKMTGFGAQLSMLSKSGLTNGETIKDELTPQTYAALTNYMDHAGLPMFMVQQFQPAMAATVLEGVELAKLGFDPAQGLDMHFAQLAAEQGKTVIGLEPLEYQINLLTSFSREEGDLFLKTTIAEMEDTEKSLDDMVNAWKTGDSKSLAKLLNESMTDTPTLMKKLLTDRNENWLPKIQDLIAGDKPAIVIVGAGHLVGDAGIVETLKKKGYKVMQL